MFFVKGLAGETNVAVHVLASFCRHRRGRRAPAPKVVRSSISDPDSSDVIPLAWRNDSILA